MRVVIAVATVAAILASSSAAPEPKHLMPQPSQFYFPTEVGTKWVNSNENFETNYSIDEVTERNGVKYVRLIEESPANPIAEWCVFAVSEKGVAAVDSSLGEPEQPFWALRLPQASHKQWDIALKLKRAAYDGANGISVSSGPEWIEVPAGRFLAICVQMDLETGDKKVCDKAWWAPNVGKVKQDRDGAIEVMKSFERGDRAKPDRIGR